MVVLDPPQLLQFWPAIWLRNLASKSTAQHREARRKFSVVHEKQVLTRRRMQVKSTFYKAMKEHVIVTQGKNCDCISVIFKWQESGSRTNDTLSTTSPDPRCSPLFLSVAFWWPQSTPAGDRDAGFWANGVAATCSLLAGRSMFKQKHYTCIFVCLFAFLFSPELCRKHHLMFSLDRWFPNFFKPPNSISTWLRTPICRQG